MKLIFKIWRRAVGMSPVTNDKKAAPGSSSVHYGDAR